MFSPTTTCASRRAIGAVASGRAHQAKRRPCLAPYVALLALAGLAGCGSATGSPRAAPSSTAANAATAHKARIVANKARSTHAPRREPAIHVPPPGSLPQTNAYPSGTSAQFKALMGALWSGIVQDSVTPAVPAFFPKGAYVQLKAIASAGSDWTDRLLHDYALDIGAAHQQLGPGAANARLVTVSVPQGYGHWVAPSVCYNSIGYYEMPNARVVYREGKEIRSFGIASMISWRGVWYVVHLGAVLRAGDEGVVDEPAGGAGVSAYSSTC